jgi:hypothetical protein
MYFFALSHAPPVFDDEIAICTPLVSAPASVPASASTPKKKPMMRGVSMTSAPGAIISRSDASVEMATQRA